MNLETYNKAEKVLSEINGEKRRLSDLKRALLRATEGGEENCISFMVSDSTGFKYPVTRATIIAAYETEIDSTQAAISIYEKEFSSL